MIWVFIRYMVQVQVSSRNGGRELATNRRTEEGRKCWLIAALGLGFRNRTQYTHERRGYDDRYDMIQLRVHVCTALL